MWDLEDFCDSITQNFKNKKMTPSQPLPPLTIILAKFIYLGLKVLT